MFSAIRLSAVYLLVMACLAGCGGDDVNVAPPPEEPKVPPVVTGAISTSNVSVKVSFSKAMSNSAIDINNYSIVQEAVNGEVGYLKITGATFVGSDRSSVLVSTLSQNEVTYRVAVVDVTDRQGLALQVEPINGQGFVSANTALFAGSPPGIGEVTDSDGDGLADNDEQLGWLVRVKNANGEFDIREVSSDPFNPDTDGDGLGDLAERNLLTDPRRFDSDSDGLSDAHEFNGVFSSPTNQDSDQDGLSDGSEVTFFKTSPLLSDTDGDQIRDDDEVILANRNPRLSDLPQPRFRVESIGLELDVRFSETDSQGSVTSTQETFSSTLAQSNSRTNTRTSEIGDKVSAGISAKTGFDATVGIGVGIGTKFSTEFQLTAGYEHSWSSSWSDETAKSTQQEYNKSLTSSREVTENTSLTRSVEAARISTLVYLSSVSDVAFTLRDIEVSALVDDPNDPGSYVPVATLVPASSNSEYNLGPLRGEIGPIIFSAKDIFPGQVERLMRDPSGVVFKISNYNVEDENGRNFAYSSQDVTDRTTTITFDYGGVDPVESYRIASSFGQPISEVAPKIALLKGISEEEVRYAYGIKDGDNESPISFDLDGRNIGVQFHTIMQDVIGLTRYDAANDAPKSEWFNSYATEIIPGSGGVERITRIRNFKNDPSLYKSWMVLTKSGLILNGGLSFGDGQSIKVNDQELSPSTGVLFGLVKDEDLDEIPARLESLHACDDASKDSDGDSLPDYFEVFGTKEVNGISEPSYVFIDDDESESVFNRWIINLEEGPSYEAFSSCNTSDTDNDGIDDHLEYGTDNQYVTDPSSQDTDNDGIGDFEEISGFVSFLRDTQGILDDNPDDIATCRDAQDSEIIASGFTLSDFPEKRAVFCVTNPLDRDTDGDGVPDGTELPIYANPNVKDINDIGDLDGDGLLGFEENNGWVVTARVASDSVESICDPSVPDSAGCQKFGELPTSEPTVVDTDGDGLNDFEEFSILTHPRLSDTDKDGRTDQQEIEVDPLTDPLDWDSDNDAFSDNDEILGWLVTVVGSEPYRVSSDPNVDDFDNDQLSDGFEKGLGTDPNKFNTDNDQYVFSDKQEQILGLNPLETNDVCVGVTFTLETTLSGANDDVNDVTVDLNIKPTEAAINAEFLYSQNKSAGRSGVRKYGPVFTILKPGQEFVVQAQTAVVHLDSGTRTANSGNKTSSPYSFSLFSSPDGLNKSDSTTFTNFVSEIDGISMRVVWDVDVLTAANADDGSSNANDRRQCQPGKTVVVNDDGTVTDADRPVAN